MARVQYWSPEGLKQLSAFKDASWASAGPPFVTIRQTVLGVRVNHSTITCRDWIRLCARMLDRVTAFIYERIENVTSTCNFRRPLHCISVRFRIDQKISILMRNHDVFFWQGEIVNFSIAYFETNLVTRIQNSLLR